MAFEVDRVRESDAFDLALVVCVPFKRAIASPDQPTDPAPSRGFFGTLDRGFGEPCGLAAYLPVDRLAHHSVDGPIPSPRAAGYERTLRVVFGLLFFVSVVLVVGVRVRFVVSRARFVRFVMTL